MEKTVAIVFLAMLACGTVLAGTYDDYVRQLKIADQSVQRKRAARSQAADALSSSTIKALYGKYYEIGETWEVVAFQQNPTEMRMTGEEEHVHAESGALGAFKYEVVDLKRGATPEVVLRVTQTTAFGAPIQDDKVEYLTLRFTDQTTQTAKAYKLKGDAKLVPVSAEGVRSRVSPLELFPLDVPEVVTAEQMEAASLHSLPELPKKLQEVASQAGFRMSVANAKWFEQDDFFGRPIQVLWQIGDPWPAYLKTANGVAILVRKGGR